MIGPQQVALLWTKIQCEAFHCLPVVVWAVFVIFVILVIFEMT